MTRRAESIIFCRLCGLLKLKINRTLCAVSNEHMCLYNPALCVYTVRCWNEWVNRLTVCIDKSLVCFRLLTWVTNAFDLKRNFTYLQHSWSSQWPWILLIVTGIESLNTEVDKQKLRTNKLSIARIPKFSIQNTGEFCCCKFDVSLFLSLFSARWITF